MGAGTAGLVATMVESHTDDASFDSGRGHSIQAAPLPERRFTSAPIS